jgi:hypothetical protein
MNKNDLNEELFQAIFNCDDTNVVEILSAGADVNLTGGRQLVFAVGATPLWLAVNLATQENTQSWIEFTDSISKAFPAITRRDRASKRTRFVQIIKLLLAAGANVNAYSHGTTPLAIAVGRADSELVSFLLAAGANPRTDSLSILSKLAKTVGKKTIAGYYNTVLHDAVEKNLLPIVEILVRKGADVTRIDHEGKTPVEIAREKGFIPIVEFLEKTQALGDRRGRTDAAV